MTTPTGILLAAGLSQRFGSNKLLHPVNGKPMLLVCAEKLAQVLPGSIVVMNNKTREFDNALEQLGLKIVINDHPEQGMGSSIARGVEAGSVAASTNASSWLIALADMPYIKTQTISTIAAKLAEGAGIVAPTYNSQRGHPVAFASQYKEALLALDKDIGAKEIIQRHKDQLELIPIDDEGVLVDIDVQPGQRKNL